VITKFLVSLLILAPLSFATAQTATAPAEPVVSNHTLGPTPEIKPEFKMPSKWYDRINLRGYTQVRFNRLGNPDSAVVSPQGDKSIGGNNSFFIRRARLIFYGDVAENVSIYIQPDFASTPEGATSNNFGQLRDLYADIYVDEAREFRFRVGQSKVPYGFENMQSSQNRLALDRNDALNSAVKDERELGVFFYWAPAEIRKRFKHLVDSGLKGSGDYGVVGVGTYNGQNPNKAEQNRDLHTVARLTYPWEFANGQIVETSVQAYMGRYGVTTGTGTALLPVEPDYLDQRWAASLIYYPQPFGFQAEYNAGVGPRLNEAQTNVEQGDVEGGYAQIMYKYRNFVPFARWQYYKGGRKHDVNAPFQDMRETELGLEYELNKALEFTAMYTWTDRNTATKPYPVRSTNLIRLQAQINY
jgi:phosphate-selective porin